jgi:hypothetical protein
MLDDATGSSSMFAPFRGHAPTRNSIAISSRRRCPRSKSHMSTWRWWAACADGSGTAVRERGDDRFVPRNDPRSNAGTASRLLLDRVPVPPGNIHAIATGTGSAGRRSAVISKTSTRHRCDQPKENLAEPLNHVMRSQRIHLRMRFLQGSAKYIHQDDPRLRCPPLRTLRLVPASGLR